MSFAIPSLRDLTERTRQAFRSYLPGADAWLWPNNIAPTAKVIGGAMYELFQRLDYVQRQKFASTAEGEWLDRHAYEVGLARNVAANSAGTVTFAAVGALVVAPGAIVARGDGVQFVTISGASTAGGSFSLPVKAVNAGKAGQTIAGTLFSAVSNVTGSPTSITADEGGLTGGADVESDAALRARILFRKRFPPHGGSAPDYVEWVSAVPGVTRVFVERLWNGPGSVRVFPITDGATADGVPTASFLSTVRAILGPKTPAGAVVTVAAPDRVPISVIISGLSPNTGAVQEAVLAELRDTFARLGRVAGIDSEHPAMPFLAIPQAFSRSWIWQAVANATGEQRHEIVQPNADVPIPPGSMPVLGPVTFL